MARKKIVFVIVEGPSDEEALNVYGSASLQQTVKCMNLLNDLL